MLRGGDGGVGQCKLESRRMRAWGDAATLTARSLPACSLPAKPRRDHRTPTQRRVPDGAHSSEWHAVMAQPCFTCKDFDRSWLALAASCVAAFAPAFELLPVFAAASSDFAEIRAASKEAICRSKLVAADKDTAARHASAVGRDQLAPSGCSMTCFRTRRHALQSGFESKQRENGERHHHQKFRICHRDSESSARSENGRCSATGQCSSRG